MMAKCHLLVEFTMRISVRMVFSARPVPSRPFLYANFARFAGVAFRQCVVGKEILNGSFEVHSYRMCEGLR